VFNNTKVMIGVMRKRWKLAAILDFGGHFEIFYLTAWHSNQNCFIDPYLQTGIENKTFASIWNEIFKNTFARHPTILSAVSVTAADASLCHPFEVSSALRSARNGDFDVPELWRKIGQKAVRTAAPLAYGDWLLTGLKTPVDFIILKNLKSYV